MDEPRMNAEMDRWSGRYRKALGRYLERVPTTNLRPAVRLGRSAVALGMETLDVARIHTLALSSVISLGRTSRTIRQRVTKQAAIFFAETTVPIEKTHTAALRAEIHARQLNQALRQRKLEVCAVNRRLQRGIARRRTQQSALVGSEEHCACLAAAVDGLQEHRRHRAHGILRTQEDERIRTSQELRNEIAQALIAVELSLLAMQAAATDNAGNLENEIANAQRLAEQYVSPTDP